MGWIDTPPLEPPGALWAQPAYVRVEDPNHPGAVARSATGAVLLAPPSDGTRWTYEPDVRVDGVGWSSENAVDALGARRWHEAGILGEGVRVAVFDVGWFGAGLDPNGFVPAGTWDCFLHPGCEVPLDPVRPSTGAADGSHGVACAEIVAAVAPAAEVHLVRVQGLTSFENAVDWAIRHEIDIISMSLSFFNSSFYDGGGPFAPLVQRLVDHDILLVASAGNAAGQNLDGVWRDVDGDGLWDVDGDNAFEVEVSAGGRRSLFVSWSEFDRCGVSDLDVEVLDAAGTIVGRSNTRQRADGGSCSPVERVTFTADTAGRYRVRVRGVRVAPAGLAIDVAVQSGRVVDGQAAGSIVDPGVHPGALTVGAVDVADYLAGPLEGFSSQGPVRSGVPKPDVVGPDGLDAAAYGASGFFGTSAATPAVAGAIALAQSEDLQAGPRAAADRVVAWALRDGPWTADPAWGAGRVRLPDRPTSDPGRVGCSTARGAALLAIVAALMLPWQRRRGV